MRLSALFQKQQQETGKNPSLAAVNLLERIYFINLAQPIKCFCGILIAQKCDYWEFWQQREALLLAFCPAAFRLLFGRAKTAKRPAVFVRFMV